MLHSRLPVLLTPARDAKAALVLCHGRGASADSLRPLVQAIDSENLLVFAPQADPIGGIPQWYPRSFLAPLSENQPALSAALGAVDRAVEAARTRGVPDDCIVLAGFSQGGCLAAEYAARQAGRWGGVAALSGALIGTGEAEDPTPALRGAGGVYADKRFDYEGSLQDTPVLLAASEYDPHIPVERLRRSAGVFTDLHAAVDLHVHPGGAHTIQPPDAGWLRSLLKRLAD